MRTLAASGLRIRLGIGLGVALSLATCSLSAQLPTGGNRKSVTEITCATASATRQHDGAQGVSHKKCAVECALAGIPVVMVEKGTNKSYVLIPTPQERRSTDTARDVISRMEDEVTITGNVFEKGGTNFLQVESVK